MNTCHAECASAYTAVVKNLGSERYDECDLSVWICGDRFVQSDFHIPPVALEKGERAFYCRRLASLLYATSCVLGGGGLAQDLSQLSKLDNALGKEPTPPPCL